MSGRPTRRWQFSLLTLLLAMSGIALVCLALRTPNELWATAVFAAAVLSLGFASLAAVYRSGRTRAFAVGFLILGAGFWALVFLAEGEQSHRQPRLPTTRWAFQLFALLHKNDFDSQVMQTAYPQITFATSPPAVTTTRVVPMLGPVTFLPQPIQLPRYSTETFLDISHQSLVMLLGVLGGVVAQWLYATRKDEASQVAAPTV